MSVPIIEVSNLGKRYRLGQFGAQSLREEVEQLTSRLRRGKKKDGDDSEEVGQDRHFWALRGTSFEVQQGEVVGIIGRNGAGKSTLLKLLSRITEPSEGEAFLRGRVASLLEVGTGFHPELTGRDNIFLSGTIMGMTRQEIRARFDEIVEFAGVEKFLETPVKRYSSGMHVRLGFAVAAHLACEILIVDEVLAVGDVDFQNKCMGKMKEVAGAGRTVLFVSHNMTSVQNLCSRALCFASGSLVDDRSANEVVSDYLAAAEARTALPIAQRTDREGTQQAKVTALRLRSTNGETDKIRPTDPVLLEVEYESDTELEHPVCALGIYDRKLTKVAHFTTSVKSLNGTRFANKGVFRCEIDSLPLNVGNYSVNVSLHAGSALLDRVERAQVLSLMAGDVFGSGKVIPAEQGLILINHDWSYSSI